MSYLTKIITFLPYKHSFYNYVHSRTAVDLVYKVHGNENFNTAPVIVIHGLLGMKKNWESVSKKINENTSKTVITVDVRNHGESPHTSSHTYHELASDISQLINKLSLKTSHIIGHSMGGRTGMVLALTEHLGRTVNVAELLANKEIPIVEISSLSRDGLKSVSNDIDKKQEYYYNFIIPFSPTKIESLIVVDISPVSTAGILNDFFPKLIKAMRTTNFERADNISKARSIARDHLASSGLVKPESSGFILMNIGPVKGGSYGWICNLDTLIKHFIDIATFPSNLNGKQYSGKTLFIGGDESNYIPPEDLNGIKQYFPKAELEYVKGVGHNVHAEDPSTFLKIVTKFLT